MFNGSGRYFAAIGAALLALIISFDGQAAGIPLAAELGPEASLAEPSGGFVGRLAVVPRQGPI